MKIPRGFKLNKQAGFTLTEMLIVIAIIAMIGTFAITNIMSRFERGKVDAAKILIRQIGTALDDFKRDCGYYPATEQGLDALFAKPTAGRPCANYNQDGYIKGKKVPQDPFVCDFIYTSDGSNYEIKSLGTDCKEGGEGNAKDISSKDL